jgi:hypothetical protein
MVMARYRVTSRAIGVTSQTLVPFTDEAIETADRPDIIMVAGVGVVVDDSPHFKRITPV